MNLDIDSTPQPDDHRSETVPNILVTTFHPSFNNLSQIVRNNWDILFHSSKTREIHSSRLITALRKTLNLRSFLVRARSDYHGKDHQKHDAAIRGRTYNVCTTVHCRYCTRIDTSGQITSSVTQRQYTSKYNVSCQSSNIVYCITCKRCPKQYVGQTKHRLMDRFQDHFYKISKALTNTDMGRHFNTLDHRGLEDVEIHIHIVDFIHITPDSAPAQRGRNVVEKNWIYRLKTMVPIGLNLIDAPIYE